MAEDAKKRILDAAFEEFALKGRAGARMQAIADRAGINKAMLNYYFTSKAQLYTEVFKEKIAEYADYVLSKVEHLTEPREFFRTLTQAHHIVMRWHPKWIRLLMLNYLEGQHDIHPYFESHGFHSSIVNKIQEFIDQGRLRKQDPHSIMVLVMALNIHAHIFSPIIKKFCPDLSEEQFLQQHNQAVMDLLEYGLFANQSA